MIYLLPHGGGRLHLLASGDRKHFEGDASACRPWRAFSGERVEFDPPVGDSALCKNCLKCTGEALEGEER